MSVIPYLDIPAINVGDILNDDSIAVEVIVREAAFTQHQGLEVTDFWVVSSDHYQPDFYKGEVNDLVLVEKADVLTGLSSEGAESLRGINAKIQEEVSFIGRVKPASRVLVSLRLGQWLRS